VLAPRAAIAALITALPDPAAPSGLWRLAEIRSGWPEVVTETRELFLVQALNLDLLGAVSFRKGCYTGQEIIARNPASRPHQPAHVSGTRGCPATAAGTPVLARARSRTRRERGTDERDGCELLATLSVGDRNETLRIGDAPPARAPAAALSGPGARLAPPTT
jgi:folate-binding protein YgfZ